MEKYAMSSPNHPYRSPGQLIQALLAERGWTQRVLATALGISDQTMHRIANDKQPVDATFALMLQEVFGEPAESFLGLQKSFDLAQARIVAAPDPERAARARLYGSLPLTEMVKRGWINVQDLRDPNIEQELRRFFKVDRLDRIEELSHAAKKSNIGEDVTPAQLAWLYRVKLIADEMIAPRYNPERLMEAVDNFCAMRSNPDAVRVVPRLLSAAGVRFVVVESLPGAKIDGVCFWLDDNSPVIGLSFRFDRIDNFWFVLRHECSHVLHGHGKAAAILDAEMEREHASVSEEEKLADSEAANFCVPVDKMDSFYQRKHPFFADIEVLAFAKRVKVHPGLVVGQLQRRMGRYDLLRKHLVAVRSHLSGAMMMDGWGDSVPTEHGAM
jgi:HTH-type transcriptional regulator/antitoxin HigA